MDLVRERLPRPEAELRAADRSKRSFESVQARLAAPSGWLPQRKIWARASALTLVAAGVAVAVLLVGRPESPLGIAVEGEVFHAGADSGLIAAPAAGERGIQFSDGTAVTLEKSASGRVAQVTARGARMRLEHGRARVRVVPRKDGEWYFNAGPCEVKVTGTRFDMDWTDNAKAQRLDVALHTGSVIVKSPLTPDGIKLRAGERLVIDLRQSLVRTSPLAAAEPLVAPVPITVVEAVAEAAPAEAPAPEARPLPGRAIRRESHRAGAWVAQVAAGEFASVMAEARRDGMEATISRVGAGDLMALADAARFTGEIALARRAFLATRNRFAGTNTAHHAAFQLGRMAEDGEGDLGKALEWYEIYLSAAGGSARTHWGEALGRKMTATLRLYGRSAAQPVATEYLRRIPSGAYAQAARAIVTDGQK